MGTKINPGKYDCYGNALPDEPMFILLARDPSAPTLLRLWATNRRREISNGNRTTSDWAMTNEAHATANEMEKWRSLNNGVWRKG